jgi:hypothetical protein
MVRECDYDRFPTVAYAVAELWLELGPNLASIPLQRT